MATISPDDIKRRFQKRNLLSGYLYKDPKFLKVAARLLEEKIIRPIERDLEKYESKKAPAEDLFEKLLSARRLGPRGIDVNVPKLIRKAPGAITKALIGEPEERKKFREKPLAERFPIKGREAAEFGTVLGVGMAGAAPQAISTLQVAEKLFKVKRTASKPEIMSAYRKFAKKEMPRTVEELAEKSGQSVGKYINTLRDELLKAHEAIRVTTGKGLLPSGEAAPEARLPFEEPKVVSPEQIKINQRKLAEAEAVVTEKYKAKEVLPGGALEGTPLGAAVPTPLEQGIAEISPKQIKEMVKPKEGVIEKGKKLYHGTSDIYLKSIEREGFKARSPELGVSLTDDPKIAQEIAEGAARGIGGKPVILEVDAAGTTPKTYFEGDPESFLAKEREYTILGKDISKLKVKNIQKPTKPVPTKPLEPRRGVEKSLEMIDEEERKLEEQLLAETRKEVEMEKKEAPYATEIQKFKNFLRIAGEKRGKEAGELFREHIPESVFGVSSDEVADALGKSENEFMAELVEDITMVSRKPAVIRRVRTKIAKIRSMAEALKLDPKFYKILEGVDRELVSGPVLYKKGKKILKYKKPPKYKKAGAVAVKPTPETLKKIADKKLKAEVRGAEKLFRGWQKAVAEGAITPKQRTRKLINEMSRLIKESTTLGEKTKYQSSILKGMSEKGELRDISKSQASELGTLTPDRAARIVGGEEGYRVFYEPAEKAGVAMQTENSVWANVVKRWRKDLNYGSLKKKQSDLTQQYAEGLISFDDLVEKIGNQKAEKSKKVARETRMFYDDFLDRMNRIRRELGRDEIPKRKDYITHSQELNLFKQFKGSLIDSDYSDFIKFIKKDAPGNPFAKQRLGGVYTSDIIASFSRYYPVATREIYMTMPIKIINQNLNFLPTNAKKYIRKFANQNLAGMPTNADAWLKDNLYAVPLGRQLLKASDWTASRVGKNLIVANLNTVLQQPSSVAMTIDEIGPTNALAGHKYYASREGWNLAHNACDVLKGRSVVDIPIGLTKKGEKVLAAPMEFFDQVMVGGSFLGGLRKGLIEKKMSTKDAVSYANDIAGRTQARYSKIARAPIMRHTFVRSTIGLFQTFTVNLYNHVTQDIPKTARKVGKKAAFKQGFLLLISALAINQIYKKAGVRKPFTLSTFIPFLGSAKYGPPPHIKITKTLLGKLTGEEDYEAKKLPSDILYYLLMPYAGGTLKKVLAALKGESRTLPSKRYRRGRKRFDIEGWDIVRTLIGGEWATAEAEKYLIKKGIKDKETFLDDIIYILTGKKEYAPK